MRLAEEDRSIHGVLALEHLERALRAVDFDRCAEDAPRARPQALRGALAERARDLGCARLALARARAERARGRGSPRTSTTATSTASSTSPPTATSTATKKGGAIGATSACAIMMSNHEPLMMMKTVSIEL